MKIESLSLLCLALMYLELRAILINYLHQVRIMSKHPTDLQSCLVLHYLHIHLTAVWKKHWHTQRMMRQKLKDIEKIVENNLGEIASVGFLSTIHGIAALIVIIMCLFDSKPTANQYGDSPKYISETEA